MLLLLALAARAGEPGWDELFDPGAIPLKPYENKEFSRLKGARRLQARGLDPQLYRPSPAAEDQVVQANNVRSQLYPGFRYFERMRAKRRAFRMLGSRLPATHVANLLGRVVEQTPEQFVAEHYHLAEDVPRHRLPSQSLQALRRSERQFAVWLEQEVAIRLQRMGARARAGGIDVLIRGLEEADPVHRARCARVLGALRDPLAGSALEHAVARERDPAVLAAVVQGRARHGGRRLASLFDRWAYGRRELRHAVVRACRGLDEDWVVPLLRARLKLERGRLVDDLQAALAVRSARETLRDGPVSFYGIPTHSRRILFCIDTSGSMLFPMDGKDGKREPRIEKTRRELLRTLGDLPRNVEFDIVTFATRVQPWKGRLVEATPEHRTQALEYLDQLRVVGGTNVYTALRHALRSGADTVYLLTDGEPTVGTIVDPALLIEEFAERTAAGGVVLHTIGLSQDQNAELLVNLAARTGGQYVASR